MLHSIWVNTPWTREDKQNNSVNFKSPPIIWPSLAYPVWCLPPLSYPLLQFGQRTIPPGPGPHCHVFDQSVFPGHSCVFFLYVHTSPWFQETPLSSSSWKCSLLFLLCILPHSIPATPPIQYKELNQGLSYWITLLAPCIFILEMVAQARLKLVTLLPQPLWVLGLTEVWPSVLLLLCVVYIHIVSIAEFALSPLLNTSFLTQLKECGIS